MTVAARRRSPRLPLWTGRTISAADYNALAERDMAERAVQRQLLDDLNSPGLTTGKVLAFHVPNGVPMCGIDPATKARIWKAMRLDGARPGAADLFIAVAGRIVLLEVKAGRGTLQPAQAAFADDCEAAGVTYRVGFGLTHCRQILAALGVFRAGAFV